MKANRLCFRCLNRGHITSNCKAAFKCQTCNETKHNSLLHYEPSSSQSGSSDRSPSDTSLNPTVEPFRQRSPTINDQTSSSMSATSRAFVASRQSILPTVLLRAKDSNGNVQLCRALLDSGSDITFITKACAKRLNLSFEPTYISVTGIDGKVTIITEKVETKISSRVMQFEHELEFAVMKRITGWLPAYTIKSELKCTCCCRTMSSSQ